MLETISEGGPIQGTIGKSKTHALMTVQALSCVLMLSKIEFKRERAERESDNLVQMEMRRDGVVQGDSGTVSSRREHSQQVEGAAGSALWSWSHKARAPLPEY